MAPRLDPGAVAVGAGMMGDRRGAVTVGAPVGTVGVVAQLDDDDDGCHGDDEDQAAPIEQEWQSAHDSLLVTVCSRRNAAIADCEMR